MTIVVIIVGLTMVMSYSMLQNECVPKKNIILGVTVPYSNHDSEETQDICTRFKRSLTRGTVICAALLIVALALPYESMKMAWGLVLLLVSMAAQYGVYIHYHRLLMEAKRRNNWRETGWKTTASDLGALAHSQKPLPMALLILPCAVALIPLAAELLGGGIYLPYRVLYLIMAAVQLLLLGVASLIRRQRGEIVGANSDLNVTLTRVRRREYLRGMLWCSWIMAGLAICMWLSNLGLLPSALSGVLAVGLTGVVVMFTMRAEFAVRRVQEKFTRLAGDTLELDDDQYWFWGLMYFNRNDPKLFVKARVGSNMGINLAKRRGQLIFIAAALLLAVIPFFGLRSMSQELIPVTYTVEDGVVTATQLGSKHYRVGDVEAVEYLDSLPSGTRDWGTAVGSYRQGKYTLEGLGRCTLHVNDPEGPYVMLTNTQGERFVFNADPVFDGLLADG